MYICLGHQYTYLSPHFILYFHFWLCQGKLVKCLTLREAQMTLRLRIPNIPYWPCLLRRHTPPSCSLLLHRSALLIPHHCCSKLTSLPVHCMESHRERRFRSGVGPPRRPLKASQPNPNFRLVWSWPWQLLRRGKSQGQFTHCLRSHAVA